jgi:hypothetical protein
MVGFTAYMTRALQLFRGYPRRAHAERAHELLRNEDDDEASSSASVVTSDMLPAAPSITASDVSLERPARTQRANSQPGLSRSTEEEQAPTQATQAVLPSQAPLPPTRSEVWSIFLTVHQDTLIYLAFFTFVGVPTYYATGYAMPLQLSLGVLGYHAALSVPASWRQFLHPVLTSSLLTVLGIWAFGASRGESLQVALGKFRTGQRYLQLWKGSQGLPGAGDMFSTVLDAGIVALALPMYQYRRELRNHFVAIIGPNVILSLASLFAYPRVCHAIGITAERSLAFSARSATLALAIPAVDNLGGDSNTVSSLAIMSGIAGALIGGRLLGLLRVPEGELDPGSEPAKLNWTLTQQTRRLCDAWSDSGGKLRSYHDSAAPANRSSRCCTIEFVDEPVRHYHSLVHFDSSSPSAGKGSGGLLKRMSSCFANKSELSWTTWT